MRSGKTRTSIVSGDVGKQTSRRGMKARKQAVTATMWASSRGMKANKQADTATSGTHKQTKNVSRTAKSHGDVTTTTTTKSHSDVTTATATAESHSDVTTTTAESHSDVTTTTAESHSDVTTTSTTAESHSDVTTTTAESHSDVTTTTAESHSDVNTTTSTAKSHSDVTTATATAESHSDVTTTTAESHSDVTTTTAENPFKTSTHHPPTTASTSTPSTRKIRAKSCVDFSGWETSAAFVIARRVIAVRAAQSKLGLPSPPRKVDFPPNRADASLAVETRRDSSRKLGILAIHRVHLTGHSHCSKKSISVQNRENSANILGEAQLVGRVLKPDVLVDVVTIFVRCIGVSSQMCGTDDLSYQGTPPDRDGS
ncbi:uncharacterized protein LOC134771419 [Penaeus indicus]|uniref:uncharacterized protein LOC134771419 n=1 Tax=Penaeus indicus TaxID=29960 RepID=UPI00300C3B2E